MSEKRKYPRVVMNGTVRVAIINEAHAKNISEGGICIVTDQVIEKGVELTLIFSLPKIDSEEKIKTFGKVAWMRKLEDAMNEGEKYEIGFEFWDLDPKYIDVIKKYIAHSVH
jgi:Tfp pilus assembly protein PilZ